MPKKTKEVSNVEGLSSLYSGVTQNLEMIHSADNALENKIIGFLAASLVTITLLLDSDHSWQLFTILGVALIAISMALSLYAIWSRVYAGAAVNVSKNLDYLSMESKKLLLQLISDTEDSIDTSTKILNKKGKVYPWILTLFVLGSMISLVSLSTNHLSSNGGVHICQKQNYRNHERHDRLKRVSKSKFEQMLEC